MKTIRLFSIAFTIALFTSSALFAQLKVGTNPTAIEINSNLEVEASTAGRKVKIDKTSGQLTIADGTQAAGKVLTSDANGAASWQTPGRLALRAPIQGYQSTGNDNRTLTFTGVDFNDIPGASVDVSSGIISLPAGTYRVSAAISIFFPAGVNLNSTMASLLVNGSLYQLLGSTRCTKYVESSPSGTTGGSSIFKLATAGQINVAGGANTKGGAQILGVNFTVLSGGEYSAVTVEKIQ